MKAIFHKPSLPIFLLLILYAVLLSACGKQKADNICCQFTAKCDYRAEADCKAAGGIPQPGATCYEHYNRCWYGDTPTAGIPAYPTVESEVPGAQAEVEVEPTSRPTMPPPQPATFFIGINMANPPLDDPDVRKAFAAAIDREDLLETTGKTQWRPATSFVPPDIWPDGRYLYNEVGINFNPDVLEDYDWIRFESMSVRLAASESAADVAEYLRDNWKEYLGVDVELALLPSDSYFDYLDQTTPDLFLLGWYADYPTPENFLLDAVHSNAHRIMWSNAEYDQLVESAFQETNLELQIAKYMDAEVILCVDMAGIIPIYYYTHYDID